MDITNGLLDIILYLTAYIYFYDTTLLFQVKWKISVLFKKISFFFLKIFFSSITDSCIRLRHIFESFMLPYWCSEKLLGGLFLSTIQKYINSPAIIIFMYPLCERVYYLFLVWVK